MIARALLRQPKILIMDEPTSAMDMKSEKQLLLNLKAYCKDMTLIIVTHKYSILTLVERVLILQQGKIIQDESKEAILAKSGKKALA